MIWLSCSISSSMNHNPFRSRNVNLSLFIKSFQCYPCRKLYEKNVQAEIKNISRKFHIWYARQYATLFRMVRDEIQKKCPLQQFSSLHLGRVINWLMLHYKTDFIIAELCILFLSIKSSFTFSGTN